MMHRRHVASAILMGFAVTGHLSAQTLGVGDVVSFITCPIAQDRGPEQDLCFFAEYRGERISLLTQTFDSTGPMLKHKMLVEGTVVKGDRQCGGIRLKGATSSLPEVSPECNEVRPFEARFAPPEPDLGRVRELEARLMADPASSVRPVPNGTELFSRPASSEWEMTYTFDSDRGDGVALQGLVEFVRAASSGKAQMIKIQAFRGATRLDDGQVVEEQAGLAQERAEKIAGIMSGLGFPAERMSVSWVERAVPLAADKAWRERRVTARITD